MGADERPERCESRRTGWCATCGSAVDLERWHPMRAPVEDGETVLYAFCSTTCRARWADEQSE